MSACIKTPFRSVSKCNIRHKNYENDCSGKFIPTKEFMSMNRNTMKFINYHENRVHFHTSEYKTEIWLRISQR